MTAAERADLRSPPASPSPAPRPAPPLRAKTVVAASSALINGVLNTAMLAASAKFGRTEEIAAYTVMTAALAGVAVVMAGGSSLLYVSGTEHERSAVRSQRLLLVIPVMALAAAIVTVFYVHRGYGAVALLAAAAACAGNSVFELQSGDLTRQLRFSTAALVVTGTKLGGLVLVVAGAPLTISLAVAAALQVGIAEARLCTGPDARPPLWRGLRARESLRAFRLNRQLYLYNAAEAFTGRASNLALSVVAPSVVVGCFGAVNSVYQAFVAILYNGLQVPMALRTRRRHGLSAHSARLSRQSELLTIGGAVLFAAVLTAGASPLTTRLLHLPLADSAYWLQLFALTLPFLTVNRAVTLNAIGGGRYRSATAASALIAGLTALALAGRMPHLSGGEAAGALLFAEAAATLVLGAVALRRTRRQRDRRDTPVVDGPVNIG